MTIPASPSLPGPFWLIGCGNMAGAMLGRWLELGMEPRLVTVIRPSGTAVADGVRVLSAYPEDEVPVLVMLGMKPQKLDEVAPRLARVLEPETRLISLLAGVELAALRQRFPAPRSIVRAMPNTPVRLGKGVVNLVGEKDDEEGLAGAASLMSALGHVERFEDERLFQAAGIVTGAGPAFLFRFIDALAQGAERIGLPADQAARLACAMVEGAAGLAASESETPAQLAARVASPGGTTQAGLAVLDRDDALARLVADTLAAGLRRSDEMAAAARAEAS